MAWLYRDWLASVFFEKVSDPNGAIRWTERGSVTNLRNNEPARPRIPGERFIQEGEDPIAALADWISYPGNRYFARSMVNRFWYELMGHGLVDPVSDMRDTNPATHPALLEHLSNAFVESGFDFRNPLRTIAASDVYAARSATQLHLLNGELVNTKLTHPESRLQRMIVAGHSNDETL
jgi:hypothetical protein